jgi:hypothetical protein
MVDWRGPASLVAVDETLALRVGTMHDAVDAVQPNYILFRPSSRRSS